MGDAKFQFICGADDFLVAKTSQERWQGICSGIEDAFNCEVVDAQAGNVSEVETAVSRFAAAVQTMPMFGGRKAVWLKGINFLGDSVTGRAEGTAVQVESIQALLENVQSAEVAVLLSASPVDRRKKAFKWFQANSNFQFLDNPKDEADVVPLLQAEAERGGHPFAGNAAAALWARLNGNLRLALEEIRKLCVYLDNQPGEPIHEEHILLLVPVFGEGDFFETVEAFYSLDLQWTLEAIRRHFFAGYDARPMISSLQGRNRLLIQMKVLMEAGEISGSWNQNTLNRVAERYGHHFGEANDKSAFNIFTQHPFYLSRLAKPLQSLSLKRLIQFQTEFLGAFQALLERPTEQESIMRETAIRCLG
jgi:DNA polymerase III subunit delta